MRRLSEVWSRPFKEILKGSMVAILGASKSEKKIGELTNEIAMLNNQIFDVIQSEVSKRADSDEIEQKCKEIYDAWDSYVDGKLDTLNEKKKKLDKFRIVRSGKRLVVKMKGVNSKLVDLESRFLKVYPIFKSTTYSELIDKMKSAASLRKGDASLEDVDDEDVNDNDDFEEKNKNS